MMQELKKTPIADIPAVCPMTNPHLAALNAEADKIQAYIEQPAQLEDATTLPVRLNFIDVHIARVSGMLSQAKTMKEYAKTTFCSDNDAELNKMSATVSNRILTAYLFELTVTCERLSTLYDVLGRLGNDLRTQISYLKEQMHCNI